jgi:aspartyl protease family protein
MKLWLVSLLYVLAIAGVFVSGNASVAGMHPLALGFACMVVTASGLLLAHRMSAYPVARQAALWAGSGLVVLIVLIFRTDIAGLGGRMSAGVARERPAIAVTGDRQLKTGDTVTLNANSSGQFFVDARVNTSYIRLVADTGASLVTLSDEDARRIGIFVGPADYTVPVSTANGRTTSAAVKLAEIRIGNIVLHDVPALVVRPGQLRISLLGMSFLRRLSKFEISGNRMILQQ